MEIPKKTTANTKKTRAPLIPPKDICCLANCALDCASYCHVMRECGCGCHTGNATGKCMLRTRKTDRRRKKKKTVPYGNINLAAGRWAEDDGRWAGHLLSYCGVQCDFLCQNCARRWEADLQKTDAAAYAEYEQARQREKDNRGGKVLIKSCSLSY